MDLRYERLYYFRRISRKTGRGLMYYEPWHRFGSFLKQREDKYKNIDRTTIRRWQSALDSRATLPGKRS